MSFATSPIDSLRSNQSEVGEQATEYSEVELNARMGAVGLSDEALSQSRRQLLDLINSLHSIGVQMDMDLPQIAVIGAQSAGKSSLIESISGIKLPRASGTCTRCPTECRLSHSGDPWRCLVSLRFIKDKEGRVLSPVQNIAFGAPIMDAVEVEDRLRRAQRAILNPSSEPSVFLLASDDEYNPAELTFSPNFVSVEISGPNVADLSFCDLPGLIASVTKGGDQGDVKLVEDLLISYIEKPSCLILLTVACETDFETQGAYNLALKYDPDRKRTVGALTKPDRIARGDEARWARFVQNEEEFLELGWYSVKQPDTVQLREGISWAEARTCEEEFFQSTLPWCSLPYTFQKHLGTACLVERLSETLSDLISKRLPELQDELQLQIQNTQDKLAKMPIPPSRDALAEMLQLLSLFNQDFLTQIEGKPHVDGLIQSIRPQQEIFREAIRATAPDFRSYPRPDAGEGERHMPEMAFLANEGTSTVNDWHALKPQPIYIDEVMQLAQNARTRELPNNYPYIVTQELIIAVVGHWARPTDAFFDSVHTIVQKFARGIVSRHFKRYQHSGLLNQIHMIMQEQIKLCEDETRHNLAWLLRLESKPFTLNTHYLADYHDKFLGYYRGCRQLQTSGSFIENVRGYSETQPEETAFLQSMRAVLSNLPPIGLLGVKPDDLARLLPPDPLDPAIDIMATVRSYFQVSYKRFADNIPLSIDNDFVRGIGQRLEAALYKGIIKSVDASESERCRRFLQETPVDASRREELTKKMERLGAAKRELLQLY